MLRRLRLLLLHWEKSLRLFKPRHSFAMATTLLVLFPLMCSPEDLVTTGLAMEKSLAYQLGQIQLNHQYISTTNNKKTKTKMTDREIERTDTVPLSIQPFLTLHVYWVHKSLWITFIPLLFEVSKSGTKLAFRLRKDLIISTAGPTTSAAHVSSDLPTICFKRAENV